MRITKIIIFTLPLLFIQCKPSKHLQNVVVVQINTDPSGLHPTNSFDAVSDNVFTYIHCKLLRQDVRTNERIPILLTQMPVASADGLTFSYELKENIKWDDGLPFTAEDVLFSTKMVKCPLTNNGPAKSNFENIKDFIPDKDNPRKFKVIAKQPYFQMAFVYEDINMLEKKHWDSAGIFDNISLKEIDDTINKIENPKVMAFMKAFNSGNNATDPKNIVGLGPYKLDTWQPGVSINLVKKESWWGDEDTSIYLQNNPDKIIFKIFPDEVSVTLALKKHNIDVSTYLTTKSVLSLMEDTLFSNYYNVEFLDQFVYQCIALNTKPTESGRIPFFEDKNVRRAFAKCVPVEEIMSTITKGKSRRQVSYTSPLNADYNTTLLPIDVDIEGAKVLLKNAGWKDTDGDGIVDKILGGKKQQFSFSIDYSAGAVAKDVLLMVKQSALKAGIEVNLNGVDFSILPALLSSHKFDAVYTALSSSSGPMDDGQLLSTENWKNGGTNYVGFGNSYSDSLISVANRLSDLKKRREIIKELQKIVYEEQPYVYLYSGKRKVVVSKRFDATKTYSERPFVLLNTLKPKEAE